jgi:hypothetical protein
VDSDGNVSITGRAVEAISLSGNTVLSGSLNITGQITMNGFSQIKGVALPSLPSDAATKEYVDTRFTGWGQMLYNTPTATALFTSGQLDTSVFNRLMPPISPIPSDYFISTSGQISILDGVDFVLQRPGNYRVRYRVGLLATTSLQILTLVLRIDNVNVPASEQYMPVDNVSVKYHDFEFIFTSSVTFNNVSIFAKVSTPTPIKTSYLCFNVTSL